MRRVRGLVLGVGHLALGALALWIFTQKSVEGVVPLDYAESQLKAYATQVRCPPGREAFTFCLKAGDRVRHLVIGDSSILAFHESNLLRDALFIGAGSCPFLRDLTVSFSVSGCGAQVKALYDEVLPALIHDVDTVYLVHRSEYLREMPIETYAEHLRASVVEIKRLKADVNIDVVFETGLLRYPPSVCRRIEHSKGTQCAPASSDWFRIRSDYLMNRDFGVRWVQPIASPNLNDYKDKLHLTGGAFRRVYEEGLALRP